MILILLIFQLSIGKNFTKKRTVPIYIKSIELKYEDSQKKEWMIKPHEDNASIEASLFINLKERGWKLNF